MAVTATPLGDGPERRLRSVLGEVFRDLLERPADQAVVALHQDGRIASWSTAAELLFGLTTAQAIGLDMAELYADDAVSAGIPGPDFAAALEHGSTISSEARLKRSDGSPFRANVHLSAILDSNGVHLGFLELIQSLEPAPRPPRRYLETLAEADLVLSSVHDAIFVQDLSGKLLYANDAAARMFGIENGRELVRRTMADMATRLEVFDERGNRIPPEVVGTLADNVDEVNLFYSRTYATNESRWELIRQTHVFDEDGNPQLVVTVGTDVTDGVRARHAERTLSETTKQLSASLDYETTLRNLAEALIPNVADWAIVVCVEDGTARKVALASTDAALAQSLRENWVRLGTNFVVPPPLLRVLETGQAELIENVTRAQLEAFATNAHELDVVRELRVHSIIMAPIIVAGRTSGVIATSRVQSRRQYDRGDLDLVSEIGRRTGTALEHTRLYRDAQHAVRLRNEFLAVAAHELRTPLAALTLQLQSLRGIVSDAEPDAIDPRVPERLQKTIRQANRLTELVDSLLDVSQVAGGRLDLHRRQADLCAIVGAVCERFADEAVRAGSKLSLHSSSPQLGYWDAERIDQVVSNLLSNAIKYGQRKPVDVGCGFENGRATVTVTDHGIGIAPENLARIFGRFERAVPEQNYGGLGLGLWIAQEIAEAHGGKVEVSSTYGEGAAFRLVLPLRPPQPEPSSPL